jgi:hypothetical protein
MVAMLKHFLQTAEHKAALILSPTVIQPYDMRCRAMPVTQQQQQQQQQQSGN